jgi:hypothetical protein
MGCRFFAILAAICVLGAFLFANVMRAAITAQATPAHETSTEESKLTDRLERAHQELEGATPVEQLSEEDVHVLVLWGYVPQKWDRYTQELDAGGDFQYWASKWLLLSGAVESLPRSNKYQDFIDCVLTMSRSYRQGLQTGVLPNRQERLRLAVAAMEATVQHAGDLKYIETRVPRQEINRILDEYFPGDM